MFSVEFDPVNVRGLYSPIRSAWLIGESWDGAPRSNPPQLVTSLMKVKL